MARNFERHFSGNVTMWNRNTELRFGELKIFGHDSFMVTSMEEKIGMILVRKMEGEPFSIWYRTFKIEDEEKRRLEDSLNEVIFSRGLIPIAASSECHDYCVAV
jgi:hypothetical protein